MNNKHKCTTANKRFGEIGVKVITRTSVSPITVSDNPNCVQSNPNFAKPLGCCTSAPEASSKRAYSLTTLQGNRHKRKNGNLLIIF